MNFELLLEYELSVFEHSFGYVWVHLRDILNLFKINFVLDFGVGNNNSSEAVDVSSVKWYVRPQAPTTPVDYYPSGLSHHLHLDSFIDIKSINPFLLRQWTPNPSTET